MNAWAGVNLRLVRVIAMLAGLAIVEFGSPASARTPPPLGMAYASDHWQNSLELYLPTSGCMPYPLAIYIHGGGWLSGDSTQVQPFVDALMRRGFAVASLNYRYSYQATFPAQIHDCKGAVRFLRARAAQFNLDPNRFVAFGDSAGGHLAALLGTSGNVSALEGTVGGNLSFSSRVQAVADFNGPTDLFAFGAIYNSPTSTVSQLFGWPIQDIIDHRNDPSYAGLVALVESANPITHASADDPPFRIVHGDADNVVPLSQSQWLHDALIAAGASSVLDIVAGGGHELPLASYEAAFDFFVQKLGIKPADLNCDGLVNVTDLLMVINSWGVCPATGPCAGDATRDGTVNVSDLLAVINGWSGTAAVGSH